MKFLYEYRTSDNAIRHGKTYAADRDEVYLQLKARGIKPSRVTEAPGLFNKLFGRGKRWMAIVLLVAIAAAASLSALRFRKAAERLDAEERQQIYGDPVAIAEASKDGWAAAFRDSGERHLVAHAIPGALCRCPRAPDAAIAAALAGGRNRRVRISDGDLRETAQMKRMVNGLKDEMNRYLAAGGTVEQYMRRMCIRQIAEHGIYEATRNEIRKSEDPAVWREKNRRLRAMGLPMVHED